MKKIIAWLGLITFFFSRLLRCAFDIIKEWVDWRGMEGGKDAVNMG
jgi:hypothetical protein